MDNTLLSLTTANAKAMGPGATLSGGATSIETFSAGTRNGHGYQASRFGTGVVNLMRPFVGTGQSYDASPRDLMAFDAIGGHPATAVPEPGTYALLLAGLAGAVGAAPPLQG